MNNTYCVIMAGGIGSRFWPLSKTSRPKQFLDILGTGETLIQQTYRRLLKVCPPENFLVVTNYIYKELVLEQLPDLQSEQVLCEPIRRNTAPCIAYASHKIACKNPDANIIVAPSDHLISKEDDFVHQLKNGLRFVSQNEALLTLGIKPSRPETGYGYIQINGEVNLEGVDNLHKVKTFTEKPDLKMAKVFLDSGEFFWNSGIFLWSLKSILKSFESHLADVNELFAKGAKYYYTEEEEAFLSKTYSECPNISIDYGVMEKASNVYVLCADFGWSDLGTWGSLWDNSDKDENGNSLNGDNIKVYDTSNSIVNVGKDKLVVVQGLEGFIVAESDNTLMICRKEDEQQIRQFVNDIRISKGEKYV
ncbi:MAG: mannose-1-phosphate guanylyltransferase [Prolixibacteraceae bacterium]|nr:mannose-1-phosphate guanylyltransferase [Prolixibacteraceae bacterium]MBN2648464.1 mannose-1-phosphate guanylyltransferase [Prolixibacteraceae bacterium]